MKDGFTLNGHTHNKPLTVENIVAREHNCYAVLCRSARRRRCSDEKICKRKKDIGEHKQQHWRWFDCMYAHSWHLVSSSFIQSLVGCFFRGMRITKTFRQVKIATMKVMLLFSSTYFCGAWWRNRRLWTYFGAAICIIFCFFSSIYLFNLSNWTICVRVSQLLVYRRRTFHLWIHSYDITKALNAGTFERTWPVEFGAFFQYACSARFSHWNELHKICLLEFNNSKKKRMKKKIAIDKKPR